MGYDGGVYRLYVHSLTHSLRTSWTAIRSIALFCSVLFYSILCRNKNK